MLKFDLKGHDKITFKMSLDQSVLELTLKSRRSILGTKQMTDVERQQWLKFLTYSKVNMLDKCTDTSDIDFFDLEFEDDYGWFERILIDTWEFSPAGETPILLTDMYGWDGIGQIGAVFVNMDLIFENSGCVMRFPGWNQSNPKYPTLSQRGKVLTHLKWYPFSPGCHDHCAKQWKQYLDV